ncbi:MAG: amino acid ABC transporter permease [Hyphomicrobiaceae bacterium]
MSTEARKPPMTAAGPWAWAQQNLFGTIWNTLTTVVIVVLLALIVPPLFDWAFAQAVWVADNATCRAASGACWGFVSEKHRFIFFGTYPFDEQWRPFIMMGILLVLVILTLNTDMWGRWLWISWLVGLPVMFILMQGGVLGLTFVSTAKWGGLPLTLILSVFGIVASFPLAVALALGRQSDLPVIRMICVGFIELIRGVPLITLLFMASLMINLFLPEGMTFDKLLRAQIAIIIFSAAYLAEVIRGGLQALPKGQGEAADALGLSYWYKMGFIILPQALKIVIPPMINTFIGLFKDTTLVSIIGLYDFLGAVRTAAQDTEWRVFFIEGLIFAALVYFVFCFAMASYGRYLEDRLNTGHR